MPLFVHFISLMKLGYLGPSALIFENYIRYSTKIHYHYYKEDNCLSQILKTVTFSCCVWRDTPWYQYCSLQRLKPAANLQAANQPPWVKTSTGCLLHVCSYTWKCAQHFICIWVFVCFGFVFFTGKEMVVQRRCTLGSQINIQTCRQLDHPTIPLCLANLSLLFGSPLMD